MPVAHLVVPIVRSVRLGARGPPTHSEPCLHACDMCLAVGGGPSRPPTTPASPVPPPPAKPAHEAQKNEAQKPASSKKTVVPCTGVEKSKRTTEKEASRQRMHEQGAEKKRIEAERAAIVFERERQANIGHAIQHGH